MSGAHVGEDYVMRACFYASARWQWHDPGEIKRLCEACFMAYAYPEQLVDAFAARLRIRDPAEKNHDR